MDSAELKEAARAAGEVVPLVKAHLVGRDRVADSNVVAGVDDAERVFMGTGAVAPPYDPETLCLLLENSNSLRQNIDAYVTNIDSNSLSCFSINASTGELTSLGQTPTEKIPRSFCLMPGGEKFVVSAGEGSHRLIVYRRDAQTGALTPLKTYDCGKGPGWVLGVKFD